MLALTKTCLCRFFSSPYLKTRIVLSKESPSLAVLQCAIENIILHHTRACIPTSDSDDDYGLSGQIRDVLWVGIQVCSMTEAIMPMVVFRGVFGKEEIVTYQPYKR